MGKELTISRPLTKKVKRGGKGRTDRRGGRGKCAGAYKNIRRGVFYESDFGPPREDLHVSRTRLAVRTACGS